MVRTWRSVLQCRIAHLLADFPCLSVCRISTHRDHSSACSWQHSHSQNNCADRVPPTFSQGSSNSSNKRSPKELYPRGITGGYGSSNVSIFCSICISLPPMFCRTLTKPIGPSQIPRHQLQRPLISSVSFYPTPISMNSHELRRTHLTTSLVKNKCLLIPMPNPH